MLRTFMLRTILSGALLPRALLPRALFTCWMLGIASTASATIFQMDLEGTVAVNHIYPAFVGQTINVSIVFDLDGSNADAFELKTTPGEPDQATWIYEGPPYNFTISGPLGTFTESTVQQETFDNLDSANEGFPYGVVDGFLIQGSKVNVDCSNGVVDPILGCSDDNAPPLFGSEFGIFLLGDPSWIDGPVLPNMIPELNDLFTARGYGESYNNGNKVLDVEYIFHEMTVTQITNVPSPASIFLLPLGLLLARLRRTRSHPILIADSRGAAR